MLKIYNTRSKTKETFQSIEKNKVSMYVCGPTVYDLLHVGNFRGAIFFNLVRNHLEKLGYKVSYIYNYTDIEDKIIKKAQEKNLSTKEIATHYIKEFEKDYETLKIKKPTQTPKATSYIKGMVELIEKLVENNKAYMTNTGDVLYSVSDFEDYGKLSGKNLKMLEEGHRDIDVRVQKKSPLDFILWKMAKKDEPFWESPWGNGRPGWHIECSVMSTALLPSGIDIHGGGIDLIFPHHENEIAQSEGGYKKQFVKYWMHNNFINFKSEKMSKSLGNVILARAFMEKYDAEVFKYIILSSHYRSHSSFSTSQIQNAISALARIYSSLANAEKILSYNIESKNTKFTEIIENENKNALEALNDDFNTPLYFSSIFNVVREFNKHYKIGQKITPELSSTAKLFYEFIKDKAKVLNLLEQTPADAFLKKMDDLLLEAKNLKREKINEMVKERTLARKNKNYKKSDLLRNNLMGLGIELHDTKDETFWEVKK